MKSLYCAILLTLTWSALICGREPTVVVFDTDITGDVDDVLALAMLHSLSDRGECEIRAVTVSKIHPLAASFVDATNTFYGRPDIPIGITHNAQKRDSRYLSLIKTRDNGELRYPHDLVMPGDAENAVTLLRRTLAQADDHSIVLVQVGLAANLADLLDSKPDSASGLDGVSLVRNKVQLLSVMAGAFSPVNGNDHYLEANVRNGIESMQRLARYWPNEVPVHWSDFEVGITLRYPRESIARDFAYRRHHIVRESYLLHSGPDHDRPSWDLTSVLHAVRPDDGYFELGPSGRVTVGDDGFTSFKESEGGRDRLLAVRPESVARVIATLRTLVSQPPVQPCE
ncbi:MAG: nucleoside hydrolase [Planctomycetota bacterium]